MTNNDNKDPQIREAFEKFHAEQFGWELTRPEHYQDIRVAERFRIWQAATEQQAAELKQLRAERAVILADVEHILYRLHEAKSEGVCSWPHCFNEIRTRAVWIKSTLTDSAQRGEGE